eukprot:Colp12_sorted_trinity150504_noHs@14920
MPIYTAECLNRKPSRLQFGVDNKRFKSRVVLVERDERGTLFRRVVTKGSSANCKDDSRANHTQAIDLYNFARLILFSDFRWICKSNILFLADRPTFGGGKLGEEPI